MRRSRNCSAFSDIVDELEENEFFSYVEGKHIREVKDLVVRRQELFPDPPNLLEAMPILPCEGHIIDAIPDATRRSLFVDTENLFELGPKLFVDELQPVLARAGLTLIDTYKYGSCGVGVVWAGGCCEGVILNQQEIEKGRDRWTLAFTRTLALLNEALTAVGGHERVFMRGGGNDANVIFLTHRQFEIIRSRSDMPNSCKPIAIGKDGLFKGQIV